MIFPDEINHLLTIFPTEISPLSVSPEGEMKVTLVLIPDMTKGYVTHGHGKGKILGTT